MDPDYKILKFTFYIPGGHDDAAGLRRPKL